MRKFQINFSRSLSESYKDVIDHGFDITKVYTYTKETFSDIKNIHVLDNESVRINGVLFYGDTLYTIQSKKFVE